MKKIIFVFQFVLLVGQILGQTKLVEQETISEYVGTSYIYTGQVKIKATNTSSFHFNGVNGSFFIRPAEGISSPKNVPPSLDQNFVKTEDILVPGILSESQIPGLSIPGSQLNSSYEYFDDLGRKILVSAVQASPSFKDIMVPYRYEDNKLVKEYLPFSYNQSNGAFRSNAENEALSFYSAPPNGIVSDSRPFVEKAFEISPLSRVTDVYGPGSEWKNSSVTKGSKTLSKVNLSSESIIKWKHYITGLPANDGVYASNQLLVNESIDEGGKIAKVYSNLLDEVILSREGDGTTWYDTYYLYSPSGQLTLVIQPEGVSRLDNEFFAAGADKQSFINRWCFQYQYDDEQRLIAKRIPGWKPNFWESTVYDKWNRPVFTQTPAQRDRNEWLFNKYDCFNRVVVTGLYSSSSDRAALQSAVNTFYTNNPNNRFETSQNNSTGYTLGTTYPQSPSESSLISVTYYDNYGFKTYSNWDAESVSNFNYESIDGFTASSDILSSVKGHITGSKTRVLGLSRWLNSVIYYNKKYQVVQNINENFVGGEGYSGGLDKVTTKYTFSGKVEKTQLNHTSPFSSLTVLREFSYDHTGHLLKTYQTTDGNRVLLASYNYNEAGRLIEKNVHSTDEGASFLQSIDYRYNIRGWLTHINNSALSYDPSMNNDSNDLFGQEILYNPSSPPSISGYPSSGSVVPKLYNGNITAIKWKTDTKQGAAEEQIYGFEYDILNRFKKAHYAKTNSGAWSGDVGMFNEEVKNYDKNGNIQGIIRNGKVNGTLSTIDNTTYTYNYTGPIQNFSGEGNRLLKVADSGNNYGFKDGANSTEEFTYDASGNLTYDANKQITSIEYNHLNLPTAVAFTRTDGSVDRIRYTYDANGAKLSTTVFQAGGTSSNGTQVWKTEYAGETQYDNNAFAFASTPEGRVVKNSTGFDYEYFHKDHQGNVRLAYSARKETVSFRATMENPPSPSTLANDEANTFKNISATRVTYPDANYTKLSDKIPAPDKVAETSSYINKPVGPAKNLKVLNGDKIKVEVFAKYTQNSGGTATILPTALVSAIASGTFGFNTGETGYNSFANNSPTIAGSGNSSSTVPKAYLALLLFTDNFEYVPLSARAVAVTTSAYNAFERLEITFTVPQNGNVYIYTANESATSTSKVYFDEMTIVHQKNNTALQVTQANDYYPFGLTFNSYQQERISEDHKKVQNNRYGFQGQELQKDLDLGWSQFKWRMHDPAIGRFTSVDPLSDKYVYNSTYAFQENKLGSGIELEGLELMAIDHQVQLGLFVGNLLYNTIGLGTAERTAYAMRDYAANDIDHAMNQGERYQQAIEANQGNIHAVQAEYELRKFAAKAELLNVGMEWFAFSTGSAIGALEGAAYSVISPSGRMLLYKSSNGTDISLGLNPPGSGKMAKFASTFDNAPFNEQWLENGLRSADVGSFAEAFNQATTKVLKNGGRIKFDLSDFDINKAMKAKGKDLYDPGVGYTDWEFNQVIQNKNLLNITDFYRDGKLISSTEVLKQAGY